MQDTLQKENDDVVVAEIHEYRDDVIRGVVFKDTTRVKSIHALGTKLHAMMRYYRGLGIVCNGHLRINLAHVLSSYVHARRTHCFSYQYKCYNTGDTCKIVISHVASNVQ